MPALKRMLHLVINPFIFNANGRGQDVTSYPAAKFPGSVPPVPKQALFILTSVEHLDSISVM
jgi:hypothetical protein